MKKRIGIIGAGPSGTAVLRAFQSAAVKGADIPEIVCFEKQSDWGGLWNYSWRTGLDEFGEPVHASMYRYLWSNAPKETLEFADYSFDEHFGQPIASYPPREVLADYIKGRVEKAGVRDWCRFNHSVKWVSYDEDSGLFKITAKDLVRDVQYEETFDHVVVASGHFSTPNVPHFEGFDEFNGRVLHAHDFRDALEFKDKDVLIVGTSYSAEDIGSQCWKYGCKSVTVSHRTKPIGYAFPNNWQEVPLLERVDNRTCYFKDGTHKDVDAIILCTGYVHYFPFLEEDLRLKTDNRLATNDLYKGVVWVHNPKMFYVGMQNTWFSFNLFDSEAWWVRDAILDRIEIPKDKSVLLADVARRQAAEDAAEDVIRFQGDHMFELIEETDYPKFDMPGACELLYQWLDHKAEDFMGWRDRCYPSVITGTMSTKHHTPWVSCMNDSLADYLRTTD